MYLFELLYQYLEDHYFSSSLGENYEHLDFAKTSTTLLMIVGGLCLGMLIASILAVIQKKHVGKLARALLAAEANDEASAKSLAELGLDKSVFVKMELSRPSALRKLLGIVEEGKSFTYLDELAEAFPEYAAKIRSEQGEAEDAVSEEAKEKETAEITETAAEARETAEESSPSEKKKLPFLEKGFRVRKINLETAKFFIPESLRYRAEFRFREKGNSWWGVLIGAVALIALFLLCLRFIPMFVSMLDVSIGNVIGK